MKKILAISLAIAMVFSIALVVLAAPTDFLADNRFHCPYKDDGGRVWYPDGVEPDYAICPYCKNEVEWVRKSNNGNGNANNVQYIHAKAEAEAEAEEPYIVSKVVEYVRFTYGQMENGNKDNILQINVFEKITITWSNGVIDVIDEVMTTKYFNGLSNQLNNVEFKVESEYADFDNIKAVYLFNAIGNFNNTVIVTKK